MNCIRFYVPFTWAWTLALAAMSVPSLAADPPTPKLTPLNLAPGGLFLTVDAPEGATSKAAAKSATVNHGERWHLSIHEMEEFLTDVVEKSRKSYRENKSSKIVVDTKNVFVAGTPLLGDDTFAVYAVVTVGDKQYLCLSDGGNLTEPEARLMATCAATLRRTAENTRDEKAMQAAVEKLDSLDCEFKDAFNHITLEGDKVKDEHLKILKDIPQAHWVIVKNARLSPVGLRRLKDLPNLEAVSFEGKRVTDAWLEPVADLPKLQRLWLEKTSVTASGWRSIAKLSKLTELKVSATKISGQALRNLAPLTTLLELDLSESILNDAGLEHLAEVKSHRTLNLEGTNVDDAGIARLERCTQLISLNLRETAVTPRGVEKLKRAVPKCRISHD